MSSRANFGMRADLNDLMCTIFERVGFRDKLRCQFVCKFWQETLRSSLLTWCDELEIRTSGAVLRMCHPKRNLDNRDAKTVVRIDSRADGREEFVFPRIGLILLQMPSPFGCI